MQMKRKGDSASYRWSPCVQEPHPLLADPACTNAVGGALKTVNKHYPTLGCMAESKFQLVCSNGVTVDFAKPFGEQVRQSEAVDRNFQVTPWRFEELAGPHVVMRRALAKEMSDYLLEFEGDGPNLVEKFGDRLVELMRAGDKVLQHVYYEPAGGRLDGHDPHVGLEEAIYSLRLDAGSSSGARAGMEEWVLEYGPLGNNGKGQKRELREAALGKIDRVSELGYVAVCDASVLKDAKEESKCNEDKVKLLGARECVIDEVSTDSR